MAQLVSHQTIPNTTGELTPLPLDGVVSCVSPLYQTKAIDETCQSLTALRAHSLHQTGIVDQWLQNLSGRQMDRYSHPINFSSSGNQAKNS